MPRSSTTNGQRECARASRSHARSRAGADHLEAQLWPLGCDGLLERCSERALGWLCTRDIGVAHGQAPYLLGYLRLSPTKLKMIHNSVDPARYPPLTDRRREFGLDEHDAVVAVNAVLRREKDHPTILRAIHRLSLRLPRVKLLLIGDVPNARVCGAWQPSSASSSASCSWAVAPTLPSCSGPQTS